MDKQERERILTEARANLERLAYLDASPRTAALDDPRLPELAPQPALDISIMEAHIAAAIAAERTFTRELMGHAVGKALAKARRATEAELRDEVRSLHIEVTQLRSALAELRVALAAERGHVIDLPPLPLRPRVN
jgi:hypothetical protein